MTLKIRHVCPIITLLGEIIARFQLKKNKTYEVVINYSFFDIDAKLGERAFDRNVQIALIRYFENRTNRSNVKSQNGFEIKKRKRTEKSTHESARLR